MAIGYTAELSTPGIGQQSTLDQGKAAIFAAAIRKNDVYVSPAGNATFRWYTLDEATGETGAVQTLSLPVTTSGGTPPWSSVTVPANTFPAASEVWYSITYSGDWGVVTVPLSSAGDPYEGRFNTIEPPTVTLETPGDGAFVNDKAANLLTWSIYYNKDYTVSTPIAQSRAVVQWRDGASGTVNTINVSGSARQATVPASTFPTASAAVQWRVSSVTMADGATAAATGWQALTTVDAVSSARAVSPSGEYLSGNEPNVFSWEHVIATGTAQTRAQLQSSAKSGGSWTQFGSVSGAARSLAVAADTLPGGALLWRVRTYNSDSVAGEWSEAVPIVVYAAPKPPALLSTAGVPRPLLRWQSAEQQAFEVMADGESLGVTFGVAKEYRV
ncbi:MAG: hypothetical protein IJZ66_00200, partial [Oscillibacter sp.]|nr:hypothetical protein [Oscillibacter sp.]